MKECEKSFQLERPASAKQEEIWSIEEKQEGYCAWSRIRDGKSN